jgi:hypothetical protein
MVRFWNCCHRFVRQPRLRVDDATISRPQEEHVAALRRAGNPRCGSTASAAQVADALQRIPLALVFWMKSSGRGRGGGSGGMIAGGRRHMRLLPARGDLVGRVVRREGDNAYGSRCFVDAKDGAPGDAVAVAQRRSASTLELAGLRRELLRVGLKRANQRCQRRPERVCRVLLCDQIRDVTVQTDVPREGGRRG